MCSDCPTTCEERDLVCQVSTPGAMESQTQPVCQRGCGLLLPDEDAGAGEHCCVDALRALSDALEERSATLEHDLRMTRLRWNRREQFLLTKVSALQNEAQLAALKYQRRLHQYMLHISSIAEQVVSYCKGDARTGSMESRVAEGALEPEMCFQQNKLFNLESTLEPSCQFPD